MNATTENTIVTVMGVFGLVLLVSSIKQGLYTLPVIFVVSIVGFVVYGWWVRRRER